MPIYAYRCDACGHAKDVLQKMSDPVLTTCPACGAEAFKKQVTAAGFQLKGSGWYVTDFRGGQATAPAAEKTGDKEGAPGGEAAKKAETPAGEKPATAASAPAGPSSAAPAPAPSPASSAPAPAPAAAPGSPPKAG
jgi:putative FmdB family regulatory protein